MCIGLGEQGKLGRERRSIPSFAKLFYFMYWTPPSLEGPRHILSPCHDPDHEQKDSGGIPGSRLRVWTSTSALSSGLDAVIYFWQREVCGGYPLVSVCRLLIALTSLVAENGL